MNLSPKEWLVFLVSVVAYLYIGYALDRSQFGQLLFCFFLLFGSYAFLIRPVLTEEVSMDSATVNRWLRLSLVFRLLFIFSVPVLSDDYFRFLWDGNMIMNDYNPYLVRPDLVYEMQGIAELPLTKSLYNGMNSPAYYTVYPPLMQSVFGMAVGLFPNDILGSLLVIRVVIFTAEAGTIFLIKRLVEQLRARPGAVLIYALNPLVIVELTGNLHTEAIMLFFLMLALNLLWSQKWLPSAIVFGASVAAKLLPLMFLPVLFPRLGWKKAILYGGISILVVVALFVPFLDAAMTAHFFSSIALYFRTFEFNASIYYMVREIGYAVNGYNIINIAGPVMAGITFLVIMILLLRTRNKEWPAFFEALLWSFTFFLLMSTTVHPWYLTPLVLFAVFVKKSQYALVWSGLVVLTYAAYRQAGYEEELWLVSVEYLLVAFWWIYEYQWRGKKRKVLIAGND